MTDDLLSRTHEDIAIMRRAMDLQPFPSKSMLIFNILMALIAICAAVFSGWLETDWLQQLQFAVIVATVVVGLGIGSRKTPHEQNLQVLVSLTIYVVVWVASCGYMLAAMVGTPLGFERSALLYATCVLFLLAFTVMLVRSALSSRARYFSLGLAISTVLTGMLLPIVGQAYVYSLAHCFMAIGYMACFAIQWSQLRQSVVAPAFE